MGLTFKIQNNANVDKTVTGFSASVNKPTQNFQSFDWGYQTPNQTLVPFFNTSQIATQTFFYRVWNVGYTQQFGGTFLVGGTFNQFIAQFALDARLFNPAINALFKGYFTVPKTGALAGLPTAYFYFNDDNPEDWYEVILYNGSLPSGISWNFKQVAAPTNGGITSTATDPAVYSLGTVPPQQIQQATVGYSFSVTSLYINASSAAQVMQPITYGRRDANGNLKTEGYDPIIDPNQTYSGSLKSSDLNKFVLDGNAQLDFSVLQGQTGQYQFEYAQLSYDEIKNQALAIQMQKEYEIIKAAKGIKAANNFANFYFFS
jgi:hypothetical protein